MQLDLKWIFLLFWLDLYTSLWNFNEKSTTVLKLDWSIEYVSQKSKKQNKQIDATMGVSNPRKLREKYST